MCCCCCFVIVVVVAAAVVVVSPVYCSLENEQSHDFVLQQQNVFRDLVSVRYNVVVLVWVQYVVVVFVVVTCIY